MPARHVGGMASEAARNDLYNGLTELLGPERAETLMTYLPAYDPSEVATKSDLRELKQELKSEIGEMKQELRSEMGELSKRIDRVLLTLAAGLFVIFAAVVGLIGVVVAAL